MCKKKLQLKPTRIGNSKGFIIPSHDVKLRLERVYDVTIEYPEGEKLG